MFNYEKLPFFFIITFGNSTEGTNMFLRIKDFFSESRPNAPLAADFNRDGFTDIAITDFDYSGFSISFGNVSGNFFLDSSYKSNLSGSIAGLILSKDFNRDSFIDLARVDELGKIYIHLGKGDGTFQTKISTIPGFYPSGLCSADFNGDKKNDLVVTQKDSNYISVYLGNGNGYFSDSLNFKVANLLGDLCSADFNNDGKLDIALTRGSNYFTGDVRILLNCTSTGIENVIDKTEITIYPNPSSNQFFIESLTTNNKLLQLFDLSGKLLITQNYTDKTMLDATILIEGIYLLCIKSTNGVIYRKLLVAR